MATTANGNPMSIPEYTEDRITGEVARVGVIHGFPRPHYKSPWPDGLDNGPLTDRKISRYMKKGKYALQAEAKAFRKQKAKKSKLTDFV